MENKLRRKFVLFSTSAMILVIFVIATVINSFNFYKLNLKNENILNFIAQNGGTFPKPNENNIKIFIEEDISPEDAFSTRFFTVNLDTDNKIAKVNTNDIYLVTYDEAINYAKKVLGKKSGIIGNYKYKIFTIDKGISIIFTDISNDLNIFNSFLISSFYISFTAIIAVIVVSAILSKKAIKPILETYNKQKAFITNASHELKTPLAIINTNIDVIEMENGENAWTQSVHNQVKRLNELINNMIKLSKLEETNEKIEVKSFDISKTLSEILIEFNSLAMQNKKSFVTNINENINFNGNENLIRELFTILIENSIKYSSEEKINLSLQKNGKKIQFEISNSAEIEKGSHNEIFDRFTRKDKSRNSKIKGYGIGLSIAKSIVEKHKGKINAVSKKDGELRIMVEI